MRFATNAESVFPCTELAAVSWMRGHFGEVCASFSQQFHAKMQPNVIPVNNKQGKRLISCTILHCQALQKV